jgi:hypothetical protein
MLAIATAATKSYLYAFPQCLRAIAAAAAHHEKAFFILATDESEDGKEAESLCKAELPSGWEIMVIRIKMEDDQKDYERTAQLRIAALQGAAFSFARAKVRADMLWSVESDNIVPANALRVLEWTLAMPDAAGNPYYDVAAATYWNGLFLGGFGTAQNPIAEDFLAKEKKLSTRLKSCLDATESRIRSLTDAPPAPLPRIEKEQKRMGRLHKRIKNSSPDGNIWEVTAKHGWRQRGWMDYAYPGIGEGAVVPSGWCGLGCTLMSKHALSLADYNGYDGGGTQDLFLCWKRWHPAGIRIACVPHVVCDHVKKTGDKITHHRGYHEQNPEYRGHLRVQHQEWIGI